MIEFAINRDGSLGEMRTVESAGEASLDAAASQAISSAAPFPILPDTYPGQILLLRYHFGYDQPLSPEAPLCNGPNLGAHAADAVLHKVGNGVAPPHPISSTDPEYSEMARKMKYQSRVRIAGTVDRQGAFTDVCVLVPAGGGLYASGFGLNGNAVVFVAWMKPVSIPVLPIWFEIQTYAGLPVNTPVPPRITIRVIE